MAEHLTADKRRKIEKLYVSGVKPAEIARRMDMKPATLRQHVYRAGLTKRQEEIAEVKRQTALEVLRKVQQEMVDDFEDVLDDISAGLKIDAQRLRDGWDMVEDAAGASSLMRAKSLHLERMLRTFGVEKTEASPQYGLGFFYVNVARPVANPVAAAKPVKPAPPNEARSGSTCITIPAMNTDK
jgi:DNA-binding CsgD family transcriptional regulator